MGQTGANAWPTARSPRALSAYVCRRQALHDSVVRVRGGRLGVGAHTQMFCALGDGSFLLKFVAKPSAAIELYCCRLGRVYHCLRNNSRVCLDGRVVERGGSRLSNVPSAP